MRPICKTVDLYGKDLVHERKELSAAFARRRVCQTAECLSSAKRYMRAQPLSALKRRAETL